MQKNVSTLGRPPAGEDGFVLVTALLIMLILTIIGIAATTNTSLELQIAGNDKTHKKTFYAAEAGAIMSAEVLEQNLNCVTGFVAKAGETYALLPDEADGTIKVDVLDFAYNTYDDARYTDDAQIELSILDDTKTDLSFAVGTDPTYAYAVGQTKMQAGGSLLMNAGYERKGKAAAAGGVSLLYDIFSRHEGEGNSESIVLLGWRHLVGDESSCLY